MQDIMIRIQTDDFRCIHFAERGDPKGLEPMWVRELGLLPTSPALEIVKTDTILPPLLPTVDIKVTNGRVLLQGIVQSMQQKQAIVSDVQRAAGVENVIDQLQVQSAP